MFEDDMDNTGAGGMTDDGMQHTMPADDMAAGAPSEDMGMDSTEEKSDEAGADNGAL